MRIRDWSSDVCSSDLRGAHDVHVPADDGLDAFQGKLVGRRQGFDVAALDGYHRVDVDAGNLELRHHTGDVHVPEGRVLLGHGVPPRPAYAAPHNCGHYAGARESSHSRILQCNKIRMPMLRLAGFPPPPGPPPARPSRTCPPTPP